MRCRYDPSHSRGHGGARMHPSCHPWRSSCLQAVIHSAPPLIGCYDGSTHAQDHLTPSTHSIHSLHPLTPSPHAQDHLTPSTHSIHSLHPLTPSTHSIQDPGHLVAASRLRLPQLPLEVRGPPRSPAGLSRGAYYWPPLECTQTVELHAGWTPWTSSSFPIVRTN